MPVRRAHWIVTAILCCAPCAFAQRSDADGRTDTRTPAAAFAEYVASRCSGRDGEAALAKMAEFPHAIVRTVVEGVASPAHDDDEVRAGFEVLARFGTLDDLQLVPILARPGLEAEIEQAVLSIARRDVRALPALEKLVRAVPTAVRGAFVRAVEDLGTLEAASWIARCAERTPDVRCEAIARLGRLAQSIAAPAPEDALAVVRGVLGGVTSDALRDAVIAAGRMEDGEAVPYLVPLLREEDPGIRTDAAWALARISGLDLGQRAEAWASWYEIELAWWRDAADAAFADLEDVNPALRTRGLLEVASRRVSRDRLSLRVVPLLLDADPSVARIAAQALRSLRSKVAVAALVGALERTEPGIAFEAWRALKAITRKDLPNEVAVWRAACAG